MRTCHRPVAAALFLMLTVSLPARAEVDFTRWTIEKWIDNAVDVKWTKDGSKIVFTREVDVAGNRREHIWVADGDGSNAVDLTAGWNSQNSTADISADGTKIVWVSDRDQAFNIGGAGGGPGVQLWVMDVDGSNKRQLTADGGGSTNYRPYWSNEGRRLFWTQAWWRSEAEDRFVWQLHVADYVDDPDGGHLENQITVNERDTAFYESAEWWHDDSKLIYSSTKSNAGNYELYTLDLDTGVEERLTRHPEIDISGHPSPDGRFLAFTSARDDHSTWSHVTDASWDLNLPPLLDNVVLITANTFVAWVSPFNPQGTDIYRMNPDGSGVTRLTQWENQVGGGMPNWAPDGCRIVTSPSIGERLLDHPRVIDTRNRVRNAYLVTFDGCPGASSR